MGLQLPKRARTDGVWPRAGRPACCCSARARPRPRPSRAPGDARRRRTEQARLHLRPVALGVGRRDDRRRHRLGPDRLRVLRYRRRSDDEIPVQTRYNLPIEILYTVAPVVMVLVFFFFTVDVQNEVLDDQATTPDHTDQGRRPAVVVDVQLRRGRRARRRDRPSTTAGTTADMPDAVPAGRRDGRFELSSPDVIHSFWVPAFLIRWTSSPGRDNTLRAHARPGGHLRRQVRRAVRRLPLADALQRRGRQRRASTTPPRRTSRTRATSADGRCSAAPTPTPRPASRTSERDRRQPSDRHRSAAPRPDRAGRKHARASRSSGSSPPPTTS